MPLLKGGMLDSERELYFVRREGNNIYGGKAYQALIYDGWKLMQNDPFEPLELYHLAKDPQETTDLIAQEKKRRNELLGRMRAHIQRGGAVPWQPPVK
jgi:arylsulfatase A-like enzyme